MKPRPLLRVAGPAWELARFFLFAAYLAVASSGAGRPDMLSAPWLAAACAAGLVMPAAFLMFSIAPDRHAGYLPLLRLGKALEAATVVLLFATGAIAADSLLPIVGMRLRLLGLTRVVFALVAVLDLLVLVALLRQRTPEGRKRSP